MLSAAEQPHPISGIRLPPVVSVDSQGEPVHPVATGDIYGDAAMWEDDEAIQAAILAEKQYEQGAQRARPSRIISPSSGVVYG